MANTEASCLLLDWETQKEKLDSYKRMNERRYLRKKRLIIQAKKELQKQIEKEKPQEKAGPKEKRNEKENVEGVAIEKVLPKQHFQYFSEGICITNPILKELATREILNMKKSLTTIIFVSCRQKHGEDITGYIDFGHSLRRSHLQMRDSLNWRAVFENKICLRPTRQDLSYCDWKNISFSYNDSDNFLILHKNDELIFQHRFDKDKLVVGNIEKSPNFKRVTLTATNYQQIVFYDHIPKEM